MRPSYTVVITCYYEQKSIDEFASRLIAACKTLDREVEIVFVNDGSTDETFARLRAIYEREPIVGAIADLFRNAGQPAAMTAGITLARNDHFVFIDSDLQLDPEELPLLIMKFEEGFDIVSGYRKDRRDTFRRRMYSRVANYVMRKASRTTFRDFGCTYKVYNGKLIRAFEHGPYRVLNTVQVMSRAGRYAEVPITHHPRRYGSSGWGFGRLMDFYTENLTDISNRTFQYFAVTCGALSLLLVLRVLLGFYFAGGLLHDITPGLLLNALAIATLGMSALQIVVGEYVLRSYRKLQRVPAYVIRELLQRPRENNDGTAQ